MRSRQSELPDVEVANLLLAWPSSVSSESGSTAWWLRFRLACAVCGARAGKGEISIDCISMNAEGIWPGNYLVTGMKPGSMPVFSPSKTRSRLCTPLLWCAVLRRRLLCNRWLGSWLLLPTSCGLHPPRPATCLRFSLLPPCLWKQPTTMELSAGNLLSSLDM